MEDILRATRAEINIAQFTENILYLKNSTKQTFCLVVKGNAYGYGLVQMASIAEPLVDLFAVATVDEGVSLRSAGITKQILLLSAHTEAEIPAVCQYRLTPIISHDRFLRIYDYWAKYYSFTVPVHLKVDTGMGRAGVMPNEVVPIAKKIANYDNLLLEGFCSHFANVYDVDYTTRQLEVFSHALQELSENTIRPQYIHVANSEGILNHPKSHFNLVRAGIATYGYASDKKLKPVLSLKSKITIEKIIPKGHGVSYGSTWIATKDTKIGIVPIGYADGYYQTKHLCL